MPIYHYTSPLVFSEFRRQKLLSRLKTYFSSIDTIETEYLYLIEASILITDSDHKRLNQLLEASLLMGEAKFINRFLIIPRIGTLSPWSSKAIDILHNCNLTQIIRIERGILYQLHTTKSFTQEELTAIAHLLYDPMTESVLFDLTSKDSLFTHSTPKPVIKIDILHHGKQALLEANKKLGLTLTDEEMNDLFSFFQNTKRNPTDAELMMFAQVNSEHCRHKIFNAKWTVDEKSQPYSLFEMIRHTYAQQKEGVLSAYKDNGAVLSGNKADRFFADPDTHIYGYHNMEMPIVIKVETHNHPTAISPFPGAATGAGGEIRDEGAVGRGAQPKAGLTGFSVSNLNIPGFPQPWEIFYGKPDNIASALDIMLEAPLGAAAFNNEFGRPGICGYFRTFEMHSKNEQDTVRGYHKPIMIAGGLGNIRKEHVEKQTLPVGAKLVIIGGPALLIGIGGGAASSITSGAQNIELDFASVQRSNPEMQRRCQELINACWALGHLNPIISIHDVGAGGLSNAIPELLHDSEQGGHLFLRKIPNADSNLSPMEIWCNEAQERYVLAIYDENLPTLKALAERERCPFAVVGESTKENQLRVYDDYFSDTPVNLPQSTLFGNKTKKVRKVTHEFTKPLPFKINEFLSLDLREAAIRVLQLPTVGDKSFLITIADRSVGGMVTRDQMIGPWQVPVSDVAVTANSYTGYQGEAMAMGERAPIALLHHAASARMAVAEAVTNIAAARISKLSDVKLSANWMAASGYPGEDAGLFDAVQAIAMDLCPSLGICIPVGKDSLSMRTVWEHNSKKQSVTAPLSLIVSAFAPVTDVRKTLTPELQLTEGETDLILIDLGEGNNALGGSALAQVYNYQASLPPDLNSPNLLKSFFETIQYLNENNLLLAYHDRSDGGLFVTLCEMAFASHVGLTIELDKMGNQPISILFSEELGAVIQVRRQDLSLVLEHLGKDCLKKYTHVIGTLNTTDTIEFYYENKAVLQEKRIYFQRLWSETSYQMQAIRANPLCAKQALEHSLDPNDPGLHTKLTFDPNADITAPFIQKGIKPKVAILREQGINGHLEMAAAFDRAGFVSLDVHMTDILSGRISLSGFVGLIAGGGFSYGDVLGAGRGWAQSILQNTRARDEFTSFFQRPDTFTLGACNGCQMLSHLKEIIPGSDFWPKFIYNQSEQFEARISLVKIQDSPSIFFKNMEGSHIFMAVAHGEGRANFACETNLTEAVNSSLVVARYIDHYGEHTERYPANPNGSPLGIAGLTSRDGRVTIVMPHPERVFRSVQNTWHPKEWKEDAPTLRMFRNARAWIGE